VIFWFRGELSGNIQGVIKEYSSHYLSTFAGRTLNFFINKESKDGNRFHWSDASKYFIFVADTLTEKTNVLFIKRLFNSCIIFIHFQM